MRLYLSGDSKNQLGYTADWIKFYFEENEKDCILTLDLSGETDYNIDNLSLRFKGDVTPWTFECWDDDIDEDLSELDEDELNKRFSVQQIVEIIKKTHHFSVGLYPAYGQSDENEVIKKAEQDEISNCTGNIEIWCNDELFEQDFEFDYELNIY